MKKNKFTEFFKGKGYYVLLFVGVFAIAAVAIIGSNLSSEKDDVGEDYLDLNETDNNMVADNNEDLSKEDNDKTQEDAKKEEEDDIDLAEGESSEENDSLLEFDVYTEDEEDGVELAQGSMEETEAETEAETETEEPDAMETAGSTVQPGDSALIESLSFGPEEDLLWPVVGNVIRNYSMDHVVYYPTLMQYKCSPALVIDAEVGAEVEAAARGVVTEIETCEETGLTITTEIGDGYSLVYGQLEDVDLEIGDKVSEGQVIGQIADPTKYYIVEGSNLYFQILKEDETLNPMLFLE